MNNTNNSCIDTLYRLVFNNVFLSQKIFAFVYKIQSYSRSLRYDDIIEIDWMVSYDHLALLKEKIDRGSTLYLGYNGNELINKDFELFKRVFEEYKYFRNRHPNNRELYNIFLTNNFEAIKWFCENGYASELNLRMVKFSKDSDPRILRYLIENRWATVDYNTTFVEVSHSVFTPEILEVLKQHTPSPITSEQAKEAINCLLGNPIPLVFEYLSPLFQENIDPFEVSRACNSSHLSNYPIVEYLIENKLCKDESFIKPIYDKLKLLFNMNEFIDKVNLLDQSDNNSNNDNEFILHREIKLQQLIDQYFPQRFTKDSKIYTDYHENLIRIVNLPTDVIVKLLDHGLEFDISWFDNAVGYANKQFFRIWNIFKSRDQIIVLPNEIEFYPNSVEKWEPLNPTFGWYRTDIYIFELLVQQGYSAEFLSQTLDDAFTYYSIARSYSSLDDYKVVERLIKMGVLDCETMIYHSIEKDLHQLFKLIYPLRDKSQVQDQEILETVINTQRMELLEFLEYDATVPIDWAQINYSLNQAFLKNGYKTIQQHPDAEKVATELLETQIDRHSFENIKFMLTKFKFDCIGPFIPSILRCGDSNIVELFIQHKDTAFKDPPTRQDWERLFEDAFLHTGWDSNFSIFNSLVEHNLLPNPIASDLQKVLEEEVLSLISPRVLLLIKPLLDPIRHKFLLDAPLLHKDTQVHDFMYLIDTQIYDTVDPFVEHIIECNEQHTVQEKLEYLVCNQHRFKNKPGNTQYITNQILNTVKSPKLRSYIDKHYN